MMMISCKIATELVEKKMTVGLTVGESVRLRFHTNICSACRNYQKQSLFIDKIIARQHSHPSGLPEINEHRVEQLSKKILDKK